MGASASLSVGMTSVSRMWTLRCGETISPVSGLVRRWISAARSSAPLLDAIVAATRTGDDPAVLAVLGDAKFQQAEFSGETRLEGVRFSGDASFHSAQFLGFGGFAGAQFCGNARFSDAQFSKGAQFDGARFSESIGFYLAEFSGDAWFTAADFSGRAGFDQTRFFADARFEGAQFSQAREFGPVLVAGHLVLSYSRFAQPIVIDVAAARLICVATTFEQAATLRARYAEIVLDGAVFAKPATLAYAEAAFGAGSVVECRPLMEPTAECRPVPWAADAVASSSRCQQPHSRRNQP
jgi:uncharacterized protein YjbI with pentapeptide repeats